MQPFEYHRASSLEDALRQGALEGASYLAGGTTLVDLMRIGVMRPGRLIDLRDVSELHGFDTGGETLRFGALASMAEVADDIVLRQDYPALAESLLLAASAQLRNMATVGGNLLQRTRCLYYRDTRYSACNKRNPGSGCAAQDGVNRQHAVLGGSERCIATMPSDWAVALTAFDAAVEVAGPQGRRTVPIDSFHIPYGEHPEAETALRPGEILTAILVPASRAGRASCYVKVRDRESYAFAVSSAAVALRLEGARVAEARIALGGLSTTPWRAVASETLLRGRTIDEASIREAAARAMDGADPRPGNAFKVELGRRTVEDALLRAMRRAQEGEAA
ncbi:FAD-binding molybdopterin dehydrogenase [Pseudoroseomonas rhizosphaerae]|uniref:FAD-binding molybdopterin dehydrogenase n=1 Tax=Teichococcus rhizosphaerae TaxID=1335062 RepID=A0A2C7AJE5_9PROT|nr:xanthine dehydrogenase family protein subunit M [Pseudoroseomonas rhizosphaerae]PHK96897.1 FAD-binding molybdopterin dehydrogenase [Pseudoroseomonas rhizosphaerae]